MNETRHPKRLERKQSATLNYKPSNRELWMSAKTLTPSPLEPSLPSHIGRNIKS